VIRPQKTNIWLEKLAMRQPVIVASVPLTEMQTSVTAKEKNKEKKGAERDISFHTKINKCSFWIYKHGFGPT